MITGRMAPALLVAVVVCAASLAAADNAEAIMNLAKVRAEAEISLQALKAAADDAESGWSKTRNALWMLAERIPQACQKLRQAEESKPDVERNRAFIELCSTTQNEFHQAWREWQGSDLIEIDKDYRKARETHNSLNNALGQLMNVENNMKNTTIDITTLIPVYQAFEENGTAMKARADKALQALQDKLAAFEAELTRIEAIKPIAEVGAAMQNF